MTKVNHVPGVDGTNLLRKSWKWT